jgi:ferritin-like metal-binding protein YciE
VAKEVGLRETKLIQYLNEAYGKEKQLEQALTLHIKETDVGPYKKKLQQHLKETKAHAREVQKRIKDLGGKAEAVDLPGPQAVSGAASKVASAAGKAVAAAQGAVHSALGTSKAEKLLKQAKAEFNEEAHEIANYTAIVALAESLGDKETAKVAKSIRRDEERMQKYLVGLIPRLTKSVVTAEIPTRQRKPQAAAASSSSSSSSSSSRSSSSRSKPKAAASRAKSAASKPKAAASSAATKARSAAKPKASSSSSRSRSTAKKTSSNGSSGSTRSGSSRSSSSRSSSSRSRSTSSNKS